MTKLKYQDLLNILFASNNITLKNNVITGNAQFNNKDFAVVGVVNEAQLDNQMSCQIAKFILEQIQKSPNTDFIIIIDSGGQMTTRHAELIGLNRYLAHVAKVIHVSRNMGNRFFGLVSGKALGGAFIATALNCEKLYALGSAEIAVMWLEAMSRVTKIPLEKLQELSKTSAIFAPGAENFVKLGVVEKILDPKDFMPQVLIDLQDKNIDINHWRKNGLSRNGRTLSAPVLEKVLNAV